LLTLASITEISGLSLEIYTHADEQAQRDALTRLHGLFDGTHD